MLAQVSEATAGIFDPDDGDAAAILGKFRADTEELLGRSFDPDSKTSITGRLEKLVTDAVGELLVGHQQQLARSLDPDVDGSPMARVVAQVAGIATRLGELSEALTARHATMTALERSAVKGQAYEEQVLEMVAEVAVGYGDVAEGCGRQTGAAGNQRGDIALQLDPVGVPNSGRYVVEVKDTRLSLRAALGEASKAMANREG